MSYCDFHRGIKFPYHSLRVTYAPSEGSVMIDLSTIGSLELIENSENPKARQCLYGILNATLTPMGARHLRTNILQPSTDAEKINMRLDAVAELYANEEMLTTSRAGEFLLRLAHHFLILKSLERTCRCGKDAYRCKVAVERQVS